MNQSHHRTALPTLLVVLPLLVAACSGTETDNPVVGSPDYRSPIRFQPEPPAPGACPPTLDDTPPRLPLWGRSGNYLVGVDVVGSVPRRGLVVLDVSDPASPRVIAEQPLSGYPRQLLVEEGSATLVIDEFDSFAAPPVPAPGALEAQTKLVRFDLSTPSSPQRSAELALEGELWRVQPSSSGHWVLSSRLDPATQRCDTPPNLCNYVTREAMVLSHHTWSGTSWVAGERVELPAGARVWLTEAGFATTASRASGEQLSFVAFTAAGGLGAPRTLPLPGGVVSRSPLFFDGEHVALFSYDLSDGGAAFVLYSSEGAELGRVRGLSQGLGAGSHFVGSAALVASGSPSEPGVYIDFSDPSALRQVSLPQASAFLPLAAPGSRAQRALGWRAEPGGNATTFSLWSLEGADPVLLDSLPTALAAPEQASELELTNDRVVFSLRGANNAPLAGSLAWQGDVLSLAGPIAAGYGQQRIAVGDWLYEPDSLGLAFGNLSQGSAQRQSWDEGSLLDVSAVPGGEARLALDYERGVQLYVTRAGATQSIPVSPGARLLLPAGERLIVLSTEPADQCAQTGLDCSGYAPNAAVVQLEPLSIAAQLPLTGLPVPELGADSRVQQTWAYGSDATPAPVRLGEQIWLLEHEYLATCLSEADCAALGIQPVPIGQANVAVGQVNCEPGATSCPQPPAPTAYGEAQRRVSYVLDAATARLSDPLIVDGARGAPYALWAQPVYSRNTLLDLHLDPSSFPAPGAPPPTTSAFFLERYVLNAAGSLEALPELNIPGYPVALIHDGELLTLEPGSELAGTAQLHRVKLGPSGATVEASRALQSRVGTVKVVGQTAVYVRAPADACEPLTHLETFALDADLSPRATLELPGDGWSVIGGDEGSVVLQLGRGFARVAIGADGSPTLHSFQTAPSLVDAVQIEGEGLRAIGGNQVVRLPL